MLAFYRLSLLAACILAVLPARAQQPVITQADMPVPGDTLRLSQANVQALPAGLPALSQRGPNQTWNYTALTPAAQRVERFVAITATAPLYQLAFGPFGGANQATVASPQALPLPPGTTLPISDPIFFFRTSAADFRAVGFGLTLAGLGVPVGFVSGAAQDVIYRFPLSLASPRDSSVSEFIVNIPQTVYLRERKKRVNRVDAAGTLITPFGTFQTVRVVSSTLTRDSISSQGMPGVVIPRPLQREYKWLANNVHVPVLTIITQDLAGTEVVTSIEYRDIPRRLRVLGTTAQLPAAAVTAFPNPLGREAALRLALPASGRVVVSATDVAGRRLFERELTATGREAVVPAAAFGAFRGVALLRVQTATGVAVRRVVRE
ncbi:hypothetical protein [Hymenobacter weizhouensis]|uniref:hypothetical protein n=1 Tax=Hymenobacter sp. YIM 151500-1 TaxID=2987689 RepID=UPI002227D49A|nr:hypothetical protein [Hymenobacter sp. YIM 151500-1]UYZ63349.1 hypothetical protein OIS53_00545 [Hymenobacter sp. YIM 151500-1]